MRGESVEYLWKVYASVADGFGDHPDLDQTTASVRSVFDDLGIDLYDRVQRDSILSALAVLGHMDGMGIPYKASLGMLARTIVEAERTADIRKG